MNKILQFFAESRAELRKVIWPKKDEVVKSTTVVVIAVIFMSILLFSIDYGIDHLLGVFWK